jgi:hypothetical protein
MVTTAFVVAPAGAPAAGLHFEGTVTTSGGTAAAGACVSVRQLNDQREQTKACADGSGHYVTEALATSTGWYLYFTAPGLVPQWAPNKPNMLSAVAQTATDAGTVVDAVLLSQSGTLAGKLLDSTGTPASYATVRVHGPVDARVHTRFDGTYELPNLPVGDYTVQWLWGSSTAQYARGKTFDDAESFAVTANATTTVDDKLLAPTTTPPSNPVRLTGFIHDAQTSAPISGAKVDVILRSRMEDVGSFVTGSNGRYDAPKLPAGYYYLRVTAPGYPEQWNGFAMSFADAQAQFFSSAATVSIPLVTGAGEIAGRITDPHGAGVQAAITLSGTLTTTYGSFFTYASPMSSAPDGTYRRTLAPLNWTMEISAPALGSQWVHQKFTSIEADPITITPGAVTTVDEQFAPRGKVELTLVDEISGAPITDACFSGYAGGITIPLSCGGDAQGRYLTPDLPPGKNTYLEVGGNYLTKGSSDFRVDPGQVTKLTLHLRGAGSIVVPIAQPDGIVGACVYTVPVAFGEQWLSDSHSTCSDTGTVTIPKVRTGKTNLFVVPYGATLGVQWVGPNGGTGDRRQAVVIDVVAGQAATAPTVHLDPAGSIGGTVTSTDATLAGQEVWVRPYGIAPGLETVSTNGPYWTGRVNVGGQYQLDRLGPYAWPIEFRGMAVASVWSGNAANRFEATPVPVTGGHVSTLDISVQRSARIPFANIDLGSTPPPYWAAYSYHAITGDMLGAAVYHNYDLGELPTGPIVIAFDDYGLDGPVCWYTGPQATGSRRPAPRPVVNVVAGQTYSLRLVPGETCGAVVPQPVQTAPRRGAHGAAGAGTTTRGTAAGGTVTAGPGAATGMWERFGQGAAATVQAAAGLVRRIAG